MDPHYYTRVAMSGWVFLAVIIASLIDRDPARWNSIVNLLVGSSDHILGAVIAAGIGIGGAPTIGLIMERIASMILWIVGLNQWQYSNVRDFGARAQLSGLPVCREPGPASYHIFFYSMAPKELIEWVRRRRTQVYASLTSAIAGISGLGVTFGIGVISWVVVVITVFLCVVLICHAIREARIHREVVSTWARLCGPEMFTSVAQEGCSVVMGLVDKKKDAA